MLTQCELAEQANLTECTVVSIEGGKHEPRPSTIRDIARALALTPQSVQAACEESRRRAQVEREMPASFTAREHSDQTPRSRTNLGAEDKEAPATRRTTRVVSPEAAS